MAVDFIDTLLEDWYPGLGLRDGSRTAESIPYVNRVVPCPFCVSGATSLPPDTNKVVYNKYMCVYKYSKNNSDVMRVCTCLKDGNHDDFPL